MTKTSPAPESDIDLSKIQVERSPLYRTIYSDFVRPRIGNGDITAIFAKLHHPPGVPLDATTITEEVEIVMSWVQLKMAHLIMGAIIESIEKETGSVPLPSNFKIDSNAYRAVVKGLGLSTK